MNSRPSSSSTRNAVFSMRFMPSSSRTSSGGSGLRTKAPRRLRNGGVGFGLAASASFGGSTFCGHAQFPPGVFDEHIPLLGAARVISCGPTYAGHRRRAMAKAAKVSPFAPKSLPSVPVIEGVRFATAEAGIRYKGRTDLLVAVLDVKERSPRASRPSQKPARLRSYGAAKSFKTPNGARAGGQLGQRQHLHRQEGQRCGPDHGRCRRQGCRMRPARCLCLKHRRDRRADGCGEVRASARWNRQVRQARRLGSGRTRDHDDRHLSQARHPHGEDRRHRRPRSMASARAPA